MCSVRTDHPQIGARIGLKEYLAASNAVVRPEGRVHVFDQFLHERGHTRRIGLEISHLMSLLPIIAGSDRIATVPEDMADFCARRGEVRILPAPLEAPALQVHQFWHRRFLKDPGTAWLRIRPARAIRRARSRGMTVGRACGRRGPRIGRRARDRPADSHECSLAGVSASNTSRPFYLTRAREGVI